MTPLGDLRIGTAGWHYPSGQGTWNGVFFPKPRPKGFDELAFYARYFNTVEVNSTFYGQPRPDVCRGWAARTPAGFEFSVKLYQQFTHPRLYRERVSNTIPEDARMDAAMIAELARPSAADLDEFRRGIDPLASAGKLGALLAQFPASFKNDAPSRDALAAILRAFNGYTVAVELRHGTWSDDLGATLRLLNDFGAAWVQIDEPKFRFSIRQNYLPNVTSFYYMRLHGRNAQHWWKHEKAEDRYNYLYSSEELQEFTDTVDAARRIVKKVYLYTNNHYSAKSVANAKQIQEQLGERFGDPFTPEQTSVESGRRARAAKARPLLQ